LAISARTDASPSVETLGIAHSFSHQAHGSTTEIPVLEGITLTVQKGTFVSLLGPSGCGKTTLLRIIAGLIHARRGSILVHGQPVVDPPPGSAMVFQDHNLFPWRRAIENVEFGIEILGVSPRERRERAQRALKIVGLGDFENAYPYQLSGGMRQRVGLARAWCLDPEILLMDEPFGSLDSQTRETMQDQLLSIWEQDRKTVVFVTHSIEEAIYLSDRVVVFTARPGRIKADLAVDLPRPRSERGDEVKTSPEATRLRLELARLLKPEVLASTDDARGASS
jgi:NitT/TauT family transport system ATP-binding protein